MESGSPCVWEGCSAQHPCEPINEAAGRPLAQGAHSARFLNCDRKAGKVLIRTLAVLGENSLLSVKRASPSPEKQEVPKGIFRESIY